MEMTIELTHLLDEDNTEIFDINKIYQINPEWNYSFNVHDSGLNLIICENTK